MSTIVFNSPLVRKQRICVQVFHQVSLSMPPNKLLLGVAIATISASVSCCRIRALFVSSYLPRWLCFCPRAAAARQRIV